MGNVYKFRNTFQVVHIGNLQIVEYSEYFCVIYELVPRLTHERGGRQGGSLRDLKLLLQNFCWGIVCTVNFQKIFPILQHLVSRLTDPSNEQLNLEVVRKKRVRARHKGLLEKLSNTVNDIQHLRLPKKSELLSIKDCLIRKAAEVSKLDEDIVDDIEDEEGTAEEIDNAEAFYKFVHKKVIETEQFFTQLKEEPNNSQFPDSRFPVFQMRERGRKG